MIANKTGAYPSVEAPYRYFTFG